MFKLSVIGILVLLLVGCSQQAEPTPTPGPASTPVVTPTPIHTPIATPLPSTLTIDEYLQQCVPDAAVPVTYGDISALFGKLIQRLETLAPPAEVAQWHDLQLGMYRVIEVVLQSQPPDKAIDFEEFAGLIVSEGIQEQEVSIAGVLPEELHQQLVDAGCAGVFSIEGSIDTVTNEDVPEEDDHGDSLETATRVESRTRIPVSLRDTNDLDMLLLRGEADTDYLLILELEGTIASLTEPIQALVTVYDSLGYEMARLEEYSPTQNQIRWTADEEGEYLIIIGDRATTGSFIVSINDIPAPESLE